MISIKKIPCSASFISLLLLVLVIGLASGGYWLNQRHQQHKIFDSAYSSNPSLTTPLAVAIAPLAAAKPSRIPEIIQPTVSDPIAKIDVPNPSAPPLNLLQACWTSAELRGSTTDKIIKRQITSYPPPKSFLDQKNQLSPQLIGSIRRIKPYHSEKLVALTFDLCEAAYEKSGYDAEVINYLREHQVRTTFFAGGKWMHSHPEKTMQLMADPLFEIGNHTWTHDNLRVLSGDKLYNQIIWAQAEYQLLREKLLNSQCALKLGNTVGTRIPPSMTAFRFPYGACNTEALSAVNQNGLAAIQWNIVTGDPAKGQTSDKIARTILNQIQPGSIIVAHANGRGWHTAQALSTIIPALKSRGYQFVTISELLARGEVVAADSCYEMKPGDNLKYDRLSKTGMKR